MVPNELEGGDGRPRVGTRVADAERDRLTAAAVNAYEGAASGRGTRHRQAKVAKEPDGGVAEDNHWDGRRVHPPGGAR